MKTCLKYVGRKFVVTRLQDGKERMLMLTDSHQFAIDIYRAFDSYAIYQKIGKIWKQIQCG